MQTSPEKNSSIPASVPSADAVPSAPSVAADAVRKADPSAAGATAPNGVRRREIGGPSGPEPTRYGDWERKGRCIDF